jgi:hypothetical protein
MADTDVKCVINIVVPMKLIAEIDAEARADQRSRAAYIRLLLENRPKKDPTK